MTREDISLLPPPPGFARQRTTQKILLSLTAVSFVVTIVLLAQVSFFFGSLTCLQRLVNHQHRPESLQSLFDIDGNYFRVPPKEMTGAKSYPSGLFPSGQAQDSQLEQDDSEPEGSADDDDDANVQSLKGKAAAGEAQPKLATVSELRVTT